MEHSQLTLDQDSTRKRNSEIISVLFPSTIDNTKQMEVPWLSYVDFFFLAKIRNNLVEEGSRHLKNRTDLFYSLFP